jgi:hypothetical protein
LPGKKRDEMTYTFAAVRDRGNCMRSLYLLAALTLLPGVSGCSGPKVSRSIGASSVGTRYARLTGYFATAQAAPGGRHEEEVPGRLQHDVVLDEATLTRLTPNETCFDVIVRSESAFDEPLEQLAPTCTMHGASQAAMVDAEKVTVVDYSYVGMQTVVQAEGVAASAYLGLSIEQPAEKIVRVVMRRAAVCCPGGGLGTVGLALDDSRREVAEWDYTLAFEWTVQ